MTRDRALRIVRRWAPVVLGVLVAAAILFVVADAMARPGGGSSYSGSSSRSSSSSSSRSSSSSSSGSSSSGDSDLAFFLIWLCIEHPAIGIPLTVIVIAFFIGKKIFGGKQQDWSTGAPGGHVHHDSGPPSWEPPEGVSFAPIAAVDPGFSRIVFEDFLYGLYAEVHRTRGLPGAPLDRLSAYLSPEAAGELRTLPNVEVSAVIVGAMRPLDVDVSPEGTQIEVEFEANYTEGGHGFYTREQWTLARGPGARSRTPDRVRMLGCPGCGAPQEALFSGQCRHCRRVVNDGSFDWVIRSIDVLEREQRAPILTANVEERGTDAPTISDPNLYQTMGALQQKDPSFDVGAFQARVGLVFAQFQIAWSTRNLLGMRPFMSDALFSTQQYWISAYLAQRLRNCTDGARITNLQIVKVASDPYYDAITVRLWGAGLDYTVSDDGRVVSGNRSKERVYTEYWTFIRGTNRKGPTRTDLACSNCGGPLQVNMVGQCRFCNVKITTGEFDWVLSRIEQDDSYAG